MATLDQISDAVQRGKKKEVVPLIEEALEQGISAIDILNKGLMPAMDIIGDKFSRNEVFIPGMLVAARAMSAGTELLKPYLAEAGSEPAGKAILGTVAGDMHDIGKNLVRMMMESKGIEVIDLGVDVSAATFVEVLQENPDCTLVCLSALLTTTMPEIPVTIKAIEEAGLRDCVNIMIGGAPTSQEFCDEVHADAWTPDAGTCANVAIELLRQGPCGHALAS